MKLIARYASLTQSNLARKTLSKTANYWPLSVTSEGMPNNYSDPWWKPAWITLERSGFVVAAGTTSDPRNKSIMWNVIERSPLEPAKITMGDLYAAPYWPGIAQGEPLNEHFFLPDQNIRGFRGRSGSWYFSAMQGRSMADTFVGGLITDPTQIHPLVAAFRGAQIEVISDNDKSKNLSISTNESTTSAINYNTSGMIGASYNLYPKIILGPNLPPSPWHVTQNWRVAVDGIAGLIKVEATEDNLSAKEVVGRIGLGPKTVEQYAPDLWGNSSMRVKLFQSFGTISIEPVIGFTPRVNGEWDGIVMRQKSVNPVKKGDFFIYAAWIGPETTTPPIDFKILADGQGWKATFANGHQVASLFNATSDPTILTIPWANQNTPWLYDNQGKKSYLPVNNGITDVKLNSGQGVLIED